jgi:hypothetical protein
MKAKISLIGLGNILMGSEGVGVHAMEAPKRKYDFPEEVRLLDGGTLALDLLHLIAGMDGVLFIDAVDLKRETRGPLRSSRMKTFPFSWSPSYLYTMWVFPTFFLPPVSWDSAGESRSGGNPAGDHGNRARIIQDGHGPF